MKLKFSKKLASIITACSMCVLALTACGGGGSASGGANNVTSELGSRYETACIETINKARTNLPELKNDPELAKEALSALNKISGGKIAWEDAKVETYSGNVKTAVLYVATDEGGDQIPANGQTLVNATELTAADFTKLTNDGHFLGKSGTSVTYAAKQFERVGVASRVENGKTYVAIKIMVSSETSSENSNS